MAEIVERGCGCEDMPPQSGRKDLLFDWIPVSFCPRHEHRARLMGGGSVEKLHRCGSAGSCLSSGSGWSATSTGCTSGVRCG